MEKLLLINSCPRSEDVSRTLKLCNSFVKKYIAINSTTQLIQRNLYFENIDCYRLKEINLRDSLLEQKAFDHPMFRYAREFSAADKIVVAAPYWDLSFPSILKAYIENICVNGITFRYTQNGPEGLCSARKLIYITTCGGFSSGKHFGSQYIEAISDFLGIDGYSFISAEGLDIIGLDTDAIMEDALREIEKAAEIF